MNISRGVLSDLIQILTGLAVLVGVVLVVLELQQARQLGRAEISSRSFDLFFEDWRALRGEESMGSIVKACNSPEEMTAHDIWTMHFYFQSIITRSSRLLLLNSVAGYDFQIDADIRRNLSEILTFPTGRYWIQSRLGRNAWSERINNTARELISLSEDSFSSCNDIVAAHEDYFDVTVDPTSY